MPSLPSNQEIEYVVSQISGVALERAAGDEASMRRFAHDWFPDHDAIDHREIGRRLALGLVRMRLRVLARCERLKQEGKARQPHVER
jgi:hypothetical protein